MYMIVPQQKALKMNAVRLILLNELHRIIIRELASRILYGNFHLSFVPLTDGFHCATFTYSPILVCGDPNQ